MNTVESAWKLAQQVLLSRLYARVAQRESDPQDWLENERAAVAASFAPDPHHPAYAEAVKEADQILRGALRLVEVSSEGTEALIVQHASGRSSKPPDVPALSHDA